jgi:hypothetical protein
MQEPKTTAEQPKKSALELLQELRGEVAQLRQQNQYLFNAVGEVHRRFEELKVSLAANAKTLVSVVKELTANGTVSDEAIIGRIRKIDDDNDKARLTELQRLGIIEAAEEVSESSVVVTKRVGVDASGTETLLSEHYTVEMPLQQIEAEVKAALIGKKAGDSITLDAQEAGEKVRLEVLNVFTLKQQGEGSADGTK